VNVFARLLSGALRLTRAAWGVETPGCRRSIYGLNGLNHLSRRCPKTAGTARIQEDIQLRLIRAGERAE